MCVILAEYIICFTFFFNFRNHDILSLFVSTQRQKGSLKWIIRRLKINIYTIHFHIINMQLRIFFFSFLFIFWSLEFSMIMLQDIKALLPFQLLFYFYGICGHLSMQNYVLDYMVSSYKSFFSLLNKW